jgi:hypothetical protein
MFQFFHSLSDRLAGQEKPHPHLLHIEFHQSNYMGLCHALFALAGEHGTRSFAGQKKDSRI